MVIQRIAPVRTVEFSRTRDPTSTEIYLKRRIGELGKEKKELRARLDIATRKKQRATRRELTVQINRVFAEQREAERLLQLRKTKSFTEEQAAKSIVIMERGREQEERIGQLKFRLKEIRTGKREPDYFITTRKPTETVTIKTESPQMLEGFTSKTIVETERESIIGLIKQRDIKGAFEKAESKIVEGSKILPTPFLGASLISKRGKDYDIKFKEARASIIEGLIPSTKEELIVTGATLGVGTVIGAVARGGGALVTKVLPRAAPAVIDTARIIGIGVGSYVASKKLTDITGIKITPNFPIFRTEFERVEQKSLVEGSTEFGQTIREFAAFGGGFTLGSKITGIGIGLIRTRGRSFVELKEIIAPERPEEGGTQIFPSVKRGTTAEQLKREFFEKIPLLKEITNAARGFSTRGIPLGEEIPKSKPRGNELIGLFSAPLINPEFFRLGGRSRGMFNFNLKGSTGILPQVIRATFPELEYIPGLKPEMKIPRPTEINLKAFSESLAGSGRTFISGIKSEKEAITIFGSKYKNIGKEFFTKFKGERIPIEQIEILPAITGVNKPTISTAGFSINAASLITSLPIQPSVISSTSLLGGVFRDIFKEKGVSVPSKVIEPSYITPLSLPYVPPSSTPPPFSPPSIPPSTPSTPPSIPPSTPSTPPSIPPRIPLSPPSIPPSTPSTPPSIPPRIPLSPPIIPLKPFRTVDTIFPQGNLVSSIKKRPSKRTYLRIPSFASVQLGIKAPKIRKGEITGLVERPILRKKKKRRSK